MNATRGCGKNRNPLFNLNFKPDWRGFYKRGSARIVCAVKQVEPLFP